MFLGQKREVSDQQALAIAFAAWLRREREKQSERLVEKPRVSKFSALSWLGNGTGAGASQSWPQTLEWPKPESLGSVFAWRSSRLGPVKQAAR